MADKIELDKSVVGELVVLLGAAAGVFAQLKLENDGLSRVVFEGFEDSATELGTILTKKFNGLKMTKLETMTPQQIFDQVATHLLKQNEKSQFDTGGEGNACLYRGPRGLMCGIGALITDEEYSEKMEWLSVADLQDQGLLPERLGGEVRENMDVMGDLQKVHDDYPPSQWVMHLAYVARARGLEFRP